MIIHSQWVNRPHAKPEKVAKESKVSMAGYVPHDQLIKSMIRSGKMLYDARNAYYNAPAGEVDIDDVPVDPTTSKGFDFDDAQKALKEATKHVREVTKAREKAQKEAEKAKKATEEVAKGHTPPLDTSMAK